MNKKFKNQTLTKGELCAFFEKKNQFALMCELVDAIGPGVMPGLFVISLKVKQLSLFGFKFLICDCSNIKQLF